MAFFARLEKIIIKGYKKSSHILGCFSDFIMDLYLRICSLSEFRHSHEMAPSDSSSVSWVIVLFGPK